MRKDELATVSNAHQGVLLTEESNINLSTDGTTL